MSITPPRPEPADRAADDAGAQEIELRAREELLRVAFDDAPIGMAIVALDGRWLRVNRALARIVGYTEAELLETTFQAVTHGDDLALGTELHRQLLAGERDRYSYDKRYVHRRGHSVWVSVTVAMLRGESGRPATLLGHVQDITDRVQAREGLRESEALLTATREVADAAEEGRRRQTETLQAIFDHIPAMVTVTDATGKPYFANREWVRVSGWSIEELLQRDLLDSLHPDRDERARVLGFMRAATGSIGDFRMTTRDGRVLETTWACVRLSDGSTVGIAQDVTERRRLEEELRQAQKMEAVGRLAGGVAHDFNNLLTVIQNYGSFVAAAVPPDSAASADIHEVLQAGRRAAQLTRQLLAFSRRQLLQPRVIDVNRKVVDVVGMLRRVIGEDILLEMELAPTVWPVLADPGQIEQVLVNLAVNARDAMPDGGTLRLRTEAVAIDAADARTQQGVLPGEYVACVVEDTGVGIAPDVLPQIFEPFFTTKPTGEGTGLGLSTAYGIVKQSGGHVFAESEPGRGSRFTVLLPRRDEPSPDIGSEPAPARPRGSETVLVVEDAPAVRTVVRRMLQQLGYTVLEAASGAEALGLIETATREIHLVLTDVVMPDVHGRVLAECLLERDPSQRILYMSGYTDDNVVRRGLTKSGVGFLQKPFTHDALARAVREALDGQP